MWVDFLEEATLRPGGRWTSDPGSRATAFQEDTAGTDRRGHVAGVGCVGAARELRRVPRGAHPILPLGPVRFAGGGTGRGTEQGGRRGRQRRAECCQGARCERQASWPPRLSAWGPRPGSPSRRRLTLGWVGRAVYHSIRYTAFPCCVTSGEWLRCSSPPFLVFQWKYQCL